MHRNADIDSREIRVPWEGFSSELRVQPARRMRRGKVSRGCVTDDPETMCHSSIIVSECVGGPGPDPR